MGYSVDNKIDMVLNTKMFDELLKNNGMKKSDVHNRLERDGIALEYKSFLNLIKNRVTWRLVYAIKLADMFRVSVYDLFTVIDVDTKQPIPIASPAVSHMSHSHPIV